MSLPVISVIIVAHQRRQFIEYSLHSIVNQTLDRKYYEIIVVKDFTDIRIDSLIEKIGCKTMIVKEKNYGRKLAVAMDLAIGKIIVPLDDDDLFEPEKLSTIMNLFNEEERLIFLHNAHNILYSDGTIGLSLHHIPKDFFYYETENLSKKSLTSLIAFEPYFNVSSISFRKEIFNRSLFLSQDLVGGYDTVLFILALNFGGLIGISPQILTTYRLHESTSSSYSDTATFYNFKLNWYKRYTLSISTTREHKIGFKGLSNYFVECIMIESNLNISILSNDKIKVRYIISNLRKFVNCRSCIPLPRYIFLVMLSVARMISYRISRILYYISFKRGKFQP